LLVLTDRAAEALPLLRDGLSIRERKLVPGSWQIDVARSVMGACLAALGAREEAEPLLVAGYEGLLQSQGPSHRRTRDAERRLQAFRDPAAAQL
jgi:hypothetical protein